jgi:outer membrane protein assembly factor BamA
LLLVFLWNACSLTKTVPDGSYLLRKVHKPDIQASKAEIKKLPNLELASRYRTNQKIVGLTRFHLRIYNLGTSIKDSSINNKALRRFLRKMGEQPVLFDSSYAESACRSLQQLLFNKGYYHAEVSYTVEYKKKKNAYFTYHIKPGPQYLTYYYSFTCNDSLVAELIQNEWNKSLLKGGKRLEFDLLTQERERVFNLLRNNGYYLFKKDYIEFSIDTSQVQNNATVKLMVNAPQESEKHTAFTIDSIKVEILSPYHRRIMTPSVVNNKYVYTHNYPVSANVIESKIPFDKGDKYSQQAQELSYRRLSELGVFQNVDIQFRLSSTDSNALDMLVYLVPGNLQSLTAEPQLISSDLNNQLSNLGNYRNYGVAGVFTYSHKNFLRGAERLDLSLTLRAETQWRARSTNDAFFTNFQTGINSTLYIPSSRLWRRVADKYRFNTVKSVVSSSFIYESNKDFNRNIVPLSYSYQFFKDKSMWQFTPLEVFYSNSRIDPAFLDNINPQLLSFVKRLFANNLITSTGLRWNYTHFKAGNAKDYVMWRVNAIEVGGNLHRGLRRTFDNEKIEDTTYTVLGVTYFQFVKSEVDLRVSKYLDVNNSLAFRFNAGVGVPYGNDDILPFDKRFFIGGTNSMRGWRPRSLGPGSFVDTSSATRIDRSGDLLIQTSLEYRFKFIGPLELAVFLDAGNVWNVVENEGTNPGELFRWNRFYKEVAVNTGLGFRFDFDFFLFRLDWGIQLRDPSLLGQGTWVGDDFFKPGGLKRSLLSVGIGYPF